MAADYELARAFKYQKGGYLDKAEKHYRKAIKVDRDNVLAHINLGVVLFNQKRIKEAVEVQERAVQLAPQMAMTHSNIGVSFDMLHRHEDAIKAFTRALELDPNYITALNNIGNSLNKTNQFKVAESALKKALALNPFYVEAYNNLGMTEHGLGKTDQAISTFRKLLAENPDHGGAKMNLGLILLARGEMKEGWELLEHRWAGDRSKDKRPRWRGESLEGKRLLVWAEQGIGDEILYAGMIQDLIDSGINFLWEADPRLLPLLRRTYPGVPFIGRTIPASPEVLSFAFDVQIPAPSLGMYLRDHPSKIPSGRRSYLKADKSCGAVQRASVFLSPHEKMIGVSWSSENAAYGHGKSTNLTEWTRTIKTPGFQFVDLQYGDTAAQRASFTTNNMCFFHHFNELDIRNNIDGLASLIAACDLVITVSNTTAHLAGALGVPVWVLVPDGLGKFWYWGESGESTPWYPSATLFRKTDSSWAPVFDAVKQHLLTL